MLQCQIQHHDDSPILGCCLKQDCLHPRIYCQYCITDFHYNHLKEIYSFKKLNECMQRKVNSYQTLTGLIQQIISSINTIYEIINPLQFYQEEELQHLSQSQLNDQVEKILKIEFAEKELVQQTAGLNQQCQYLCSQYKKLKSFPLDLKFSTSTSQTSQIIQQSQSNSIKQQLQQQNKEMLEKLSINFSIDYKGSTIQLENNQRKAKNSFIGWKIATCEPKIPKKDHTVFFSFQIINSTASDIGVCQRDLILKDDYKPNLVLKLNHGAYLINQQGYVYCHKNEKLNNQNLSFSFQNGDIIQVEINYQKSKLGWTNLSSKHHFWMRFDDEGDLYPCIGINYGESISILQM